MVVETIGEAWQLGWRITARCAFGNREGMKSIRRVRLFLRLRPQNPYLDTGCAFPGLRLGGSVEMPELRIAARCAGLSHAESAADAEGETECINLAWSAPVVIV